MHWSCFVFIRFPQSRSIPRDRAGAFCECNVHLAGFLPAEGNDLASLWIGSFHVLTLQQWQRNNNQIWLSTEEGNDFNYSGTICFLWGDACVFVCLSWFFKNQQSHQLLHGQMVRQVLCQLSQKKQGGRGINTSEVAKPSPSACQ